MNENELNKLTQKITTLLGQEIPEIVTAWTISIETDRPDYDHNNGERNHYTLGQGSVFTRLGLHVAAQKRLTTEE